MNLTVNLATYRACFWQSNQIYLLDIKEKLKRQALADSENEKRLPYYLLIYGPIHWQSKILPYYLIPLCNIFPLKSCAGHGIIYNSSLQHFPAQDCAELKIEISSSKAVFAQIIVKR